MKLLFLLPYPLNTVPGQRLKFEQYFDYFRENGLEIEVRTFISAEFYRILYKKGHYLKKISYTLKAYILRLGHILEAARFDAVYLFLWVVPFGPPIFEFLLKKRGRPIVYDIDDLVYLPHSSKANKFVRLLKNKERILFCLRMADAVIVCTEYLKRYALGYNKNVTNISSTIDTRKYIFDGRGSDKKKVTLGWSGSHSTSRCLHLLDDVLRTLQGKYAISIKVIGDKDFTIPEVSLEARDWNLQAEIEELSRIDIGVYPLPDEEWMLGKSGLKALQYMGLGIPAVCSDIGEALNFIEDGVNGFLAKDQKEWIEKISLLIENPDLRKRIGLAGRKTVEERFSVNVNAPRYLKIIKDLRKGAEGENVKRDKA